ncbi:hypothetical protein [Methylobacterium oxalidis]|uniref:Uncharacterized protein n=1 Tax=Methylobacterium oxalidis TaxID=944322 RepID=A0A512J9A6_9HYPH|nr:hypothetical protein [Methylobacterium oxalidis]GEP06538.1 hypothetical protein MOX02_45760 [Methylobacterium oxalidis]GJE30734.1 hypothetical protein LDDCCGHA_0903 [Methylobacterium oxalidis]GLS63884.1 hypothetical protein GCM10007888_22650 [Methylobacterium oxalidis]
MSISVVTIVLTAVFVAGCLTIQLLQRWAVQVAEGLTVLLFTALALLTALLISEPVTGDAARGSGSISARVELLGDPFGSVQASVSEAAGSARPGSRAH